MAEPPPQEQEEIKRLPKKLVVKAEADSITASRNVPNPNSEPFPDWSNEYRTRRSSRRRRHSLVLMEESLQDLRRNRRPSRELVAMEESSQDFMNQYSPSFHINHMSNDFPLTYYSERTRTLLTPSYAETMAQYAQNNSLQPTPQSLRSHRLRTAHGILNMDSSSRGSDPVLRSLHNVVSPSESSRSVLPRYGRRWTQMWRDMHPTSNGFQPRARSCSGVIPSTQPLRSLMPSRERRSTHKILSKPTCSSIGQPAANTSQNNPQNDQSSKDSSRKHGTEKNQSVSKSSCGMSHTSGKTENTSDRTQADTPTNRKKHKKSIEASTSKQEIPPIPQISMKSPRQASTSQNITLTSKESQPSSGGCSLLSQSKAAEPENVPMRMITKTTTPPNPESLGDQPELPGDESLIEIEQKDSGPEHGQTSNALKLLQILFTETQKRKARKRPREECRKIQSQSSETIDLTESDNEEPQSEPPTLSDPPIDENVSTIPLPPELPPPLVNTTESVNKEDQDKLRDD